jgi:hypothetical protein
MIEKNYFKINLKKILLYFYIIFPVAFYAPLFIYAQASGEGYHVHFYGEAIIDISSSLVIIAAHVLSGLVIYLMPNYNVINHPKECDTTWLIVVLLLMVSLAWGGNGYLTYLSTMLLIVMFSYFRPNYLVVIPLILSVVLLIFNGQRYMIAWILMYILAYRFKLNLLKIWFLAIIGLIIFTTLFQSLKNFGEGLVSLELSDFNQLINAIATNIAPIYLTSLAYLDAHYSLNLIFGEIIPFYKLFSGESGLVDLVSYINLPSELYAEGARLGSNSSMLFSAAHGYFILIIAILLPPIRLMAKKFPDLNTIILTYLIIYAPYSIRRSITSYLFDIIFLSLIFFIGLLLKKIALNASRSRNISNQNTGPSNLNGLGGLKYNNEIVCPN